jgi:exonuclease III
LRVGSWNVLLYQSGALKMLLSQLDSHKMDITAIQEIRWTGEGMIKTIILYFIAVIGNIMFGTGFIVNRRIKHLVTGLKAKHLGYV